MRAGLDPSRFLLITLAGWMNQRQQYAIAYIVEENRVLREQIGRRRLKFTDEQRRRLAAKAKIVGTKWLSQIATIVTPDTLLAWHRKLIAQKYDGTGNRRPGRPRILAEYRFSSCGWRERTGNGDIGAFREPSQISDTITLVARWLTF
jgi:hypothetical protein